MPFVKGYIPWNKGKTLSLRIRQNMKLNRKNQNAENNPMWKGDKIGIKGIHVWLRKYFIKKNICEICEKNPFEGTEWALLKGKKNKTKRNNFF